MDIYNASCTRAHKRVAVLQQKGKWNRIAIKVAWKQRRHESCFRCVTVLSACVCVFFVYGKC